MARRVSLPTADDLFRQTGRSAERAGSPPEETVADDAAAETSRETGPETGSSPSGRVRHDEKMTVYVTSQELVAIEQARLALRSEHGLAVDRGRLVREAVAMVLADLEEHGGQSRLVRRLTGE